MAWFEYLGSTVYSDDDERKEIAIQIGKSGALFSKMRNVLICFEITLKSKIRVFNSLVLLSILLYGSEIWKDQEQNGNSLRRFESICLRPEKY